MTWHVPHGGIVPVSRESEPLFHVTPRESFAESRIREAIERGDFANVPGSGRPLDLGEENPFAGDMEVAYRILRQAGGAPLWVELGRALDDCLESLTAFAMSARSEAMRGPWPMPSATDPVIRHGLRSWWDRALSRLRGNSPSRSVVPGAARGSHLARARARARTGYLLRAEQVDLQVDRFNACRRRALTWLERPRLTAKRAADRFDREWPLDRVRQPTEQGG